MSAIDIGYFQNYGGKNKPYSQCWKDYAFTPREVFTLLRKLRGFTPDSYFDVGAADGSTLAQAVSLRCGIKVGGIEICADVVNQSKLREAQFVTVADANKFKFAPGSHWSVIQLNALQYFTFKQINTLIPRLLKHCSFLAVTGQMLESFADSDDEGAADERSRGVIKSLLTYTDWYTTLANLGTIELASAQGFILSPMSRHCEWMDSEPNNFMFELRPSSKENNVVNVLMHDNRFGAKTRVVPLHWTKQGIVIKDQSIETLCNLQPILLTLHSDKSRIAVHHRGYRDFVPGWINRPDGSLKFEYGTYL